MKRVLSLVLNECTHDSRVIKSAKSLMEEGYDVSIIALFAPGLAKKETLDGITVHRVQLRTKKLPSYRIIQLIKYLELIVRVLIEYRNRVDYVHCNDLNTLPIGTFLKVLSKRLVYVIYDAHEYETEKNGISGLYKKFMRLSEKLFLPHCDSIITVSDTIANEYTRLYDIKKPWVVLNCPHFVTGLKGNLFREKFGLLDNQKIFLYQGSLNPGRGVELILESFSSFTTDEFVIIFMGYGSLTSIISEHASKNILYHEAVSPNILLNFTASADYGIAFVEDSCLSYRYCLPNKLFEYLMANLPVITSNLPEMRKVVENYGVGVVAEENSIDGFLCAINKLVAMNHDTLRENIAETHSVFSWESQEKTLLRAYCDE